jgi:hypothetical protein
MQHEIEWEPWSLDQYNEFYYSRATFRYGGLRYYDAAFVRFEDVRELAQDQKALTALLLAQREDCELRLLAKAGIEKEGKIL